MKTGTTTGIGRIRAAVAKTRISRRDWVGDAIVTLGFSTLGLAGVFLPWANEPTGSDVNFSLSQHPGIRSAIETPWGLHALLATVAILIVGVAMLWAGPRRATALFALVSAVAGAVMVISCLGATDAMAPLFRPGVGLYVTLLTGILLMPTGIASAMVGAILVRSGRTARATGA